MNVYYNIKQRIESFTYFRGYVDESLPILVGRRTQTVTDVGYVFAPYIPVVVEPEPIYMGRLITNEMRARYATIIVNNSFYGTIRVNDD